MEKSNNKKFNTLYDELIEEGINSAKLGNLIESKKKFKQAILKNKNKYEAYISLANVFVLEKKYEKSTKILFEFLEKNQINENIINHLGKICFNFKLNKELEKLFKICKLDKDLNIKSLHFIYLIKGQYHERKLEYDSAIHAYKNSINCKKKYLEVYIKLLNLLEATNKINELRKFIDIGYKNFVTKNDKKLIDFYQCLYLTRINKYIESQKLIKESNLIDYFKVKKEFYIKILNIEIINSEKTRKYKKVVSYTVLRNQIREELNRKKTDENVIFRTISKYKIFFNKQNIKKIINNNLNDDSNLFFLVGFPRSGTTLLDTILRTHTQINVLEEKPILIDLKNSFLKKNNNRLDSLLNISENEINIIRENYFTRVSKNFTSRKKIIIDKLPLSIIELGFIKCIFPKSNIILALRHPCDTVFSCFSSSFTINEAMINFLKWDNTLKLYNEVFELYEFYEKELELNCFKIKYEDLVYDFKNQTELLLNFLNLKFQKKMTDFHLTALKRDKISTPSYRQVINPLYTTSIGRWKKYKNILNPERKLSKWLKKFNY